MRCLGIQILPTSSAQNVWGTVRRICIFISGVKGLIHQSILAVPFPLSWGQPLGIHNFFLIKKENSPGSGTSKPSIYPGLILVKLI